MKMGTKKTVTAFTFHNLFFIDLSAKPFFIIAEATPQVFKSFVFHSCPLCLFCGPYAFNLHINIVFPKKKLCLSFLNLPLNEYDFFSFLLRCIVELFGVLHRRVLADGTSARQLP
jgi:hypothetical protein